MYEWTIVVVVSVFFCLKQTIYFVNSSSKI